MRWGHILALAAWVGLTPLPAAIAVETIFTANVNRPDNLLDFNHGVSWSCSQPNEIPIVVLSEFSPGVHENDIPDQMEIDLELLTFQFNTTVAANTLQVANAIGWVKYPGGELTVTHQNFPPLGGAMKFNFSDDLAIGFGDAPIPQNPTSFLTALNIQGNRAGATPDTILLNYRVGAAAASLTLPVGASDTGADLLGRLATILSTASLPAGTSYGGVVGGVPVLLSDSADIVVGFDVLTADGSPSRFTFGSMILPPLPEPAAAVPAALLLLTTARGVRRRAGRSGGR